MRSIIGNRWMMAVSILLLAQVIGLYAYPKGEIIPNYPPLNGAPTTAGPWRVLRDIPLDTDVSELLKADDALNRIYVDNTGRSLSMFVALFKSQRTGASPHSPKVCLPGSGWTPSDAQQVSIPIPGRGSQRVNRYLVSKGEESSLVLYWYQSAHRIVAGEYMAKVYTVLDGMRYRRSDTTLVRIIVPVEGGNENAARLEAIEFVQQAYPGLRPFLPREGAN